MHLLPGAGLVILTRLLTCDCSCNYQHLPSLTAGLHACHLVHVVTLPSFFFLANVLLYGHCYRLPQCFLPGLNSRMASSEVCVTSSLCCCFCFWLHSGLIVKICPAFVRPASKLFSCGRHRLASFRIFWQHFGSLIASQGMPSAAAPSTGIACAGSQCGALPHGSRWSWLPRSCL